MMYGTMKIKIRNGAFLCCLVGYNLPYVNKLSLWDDVV